MHARPHFGNSNMQNVLNGKMGLNATKLMVEPVRSLAKWPYWRKKGVRG